MQPRTRRNFLADVGRGMMVAGIGSALACDLGLTKVFAADETKAINFGALEPLVALMQETPAEKLLPALQAQRDKGQSLKSLIAAGALANARTFAGHDYIGYHSLMALAPAFHMSEELPTERQALPVYKVLYRNTSRIQAEGGRSREKLQPLDGAEHPEHTEPEAIQTAMRAGDMSAAEKRLAAAVARGPIGEAYNHLQFAVQDEVDVHRVVLAWRAFALLDLTGPEYAESLLRQSVRYCVQAETQMKERGRSPSGIRALLPKLLDAHRLAGAKPGTKQAEDEWLLKLSQTIYAGNRDAAAEAVAMALAEGFAPDAIGEALSLAATQLVLSDPGRPPEWASSAKPVGSVHGDSVGVHASDAANAWRNIARVSNPRNTFAALIVGAYHTAGQASRKLDESYPLAGRVKEIKTEDPSELLRDLDAAVREKDQARAAALVERYGELGHNVRGVFDTLMNFAITEDGALHAEKYYRTVSEEYAATRPAFRRRHLVALARVTASEFGQPAPGCAEAKKLLGV